MNNSQDNFDPAQFNDPIAMQTQWTPANSGSTASFCTHKLVMQGTQRCIFRSSWESTRAWLIMLVLGIFLILFSIYKGGPDSVTGLVLGLPLAVMGGLFLYYKPKMIFDKSNGRYWKEKKQLKDIHALKIVSSTPLQDIHALQMLSYDSDDYYSYELNLVLKNAERINVLSHGDDEQLKKDVNQLSMFLDKPVWDAT